MATPRFFAPFPHVVEMDPMKNERYFTQFNHNYLKEYSFYESEKIFPESFLMTDYIKIVDDEQDRLTFKSNQKITRFVAAGVFNNKYKYHSITKIRGNKYFRINKYPHWIFFKDCWAFVVEINNIHIAILKIYCDCDVPPSISEITKYNINHHINFDFINKLSLVTRKIPAYQVPSYKKELCIVDKIFIKYNDFEKKIPSLKNRCISEIRKNILKKIFNVDDFLSDEIPQKLIDPENIDSIDGYKKDICQEIEKLKEHIPMSLLKLIHFARSLKKNIKERNKLFNKKPSFSEKIIIHQFLKKCEYSNIVASYYKIE